MNIDGTVDGGFNPAPGGPYASVRSLAVQADGKILLGGSFSTLLGRTHLNIARLNSPAPVAQSLAYDGSIITWLRAGAGPELWRATFEASTDGTTWIPLGAGQRIPGGWQLASVTVPAGATILARGFVSNSGVGDGVLETIQRAVPVIITDDGVFGVVSNQFGFSVANVPRQVVVVECSTDLRDWFPVQTNTVDGSSFYFSDPNWWQAPHRFYRARLWP